MVKSCGSPDLGWGGRFVVKSSATMVLDCAKFSSNAILFSGIITGIWPVSNAVVNTDLLRLAYNSDQGHKVTDLDQPRHMPRRQDAIA